ncbi:MAG TPA: BON domain-containing protein [Stellaceae bacterium]|nr:BON domain-containing protein [Stellaceae bacterium]
MSDLGSFLRLAVVLAAPIAFGGCAAAIVGGLAAAGGAGYAANQERGVGGTASDFTVKTNIQNAWIKANPNLQAELNVTVYEGRTLLTGSVPTPQMKAEAKDIASRVPGVRAVYDEVEVAPPESAWRSAKDAWISTRVRSDLVFNGNIRSVNYTVETVNGSVYLIGSARSQAELNQATAAARGIPDVKRVVSYVEIRPGMPPEAQPAPPPPAAESGPGPGPGAPAAAPTTPVEVQKL